MSCDWKSACWPIEQSHEALAAAVRQVLGHAARVQPIPGWIASDPERTARWLDTSAERLGLEVEAVSSAPRDVGAMLRRAAPALVAVQIDGRRGWLVVQRSDRRKLRVIGPDLAPRTVRVADVCAELCRPVETEFAKGVDQLLTDAGLSGRSREAARRSLLAQQMSDRAIDGCWLLRSPGSQDIRWGGRLTALVGAHLTEQCCWLLAWWLLGWMTFSGRLDGGWLLAWLLLLGCIVPFRLYGTAASGRLSLDFAASLRRRLLAGAMRLEPDRVRAEGTGGLLGRVLEVETIEQLALGGGLQSLLSVVAIMLAAGVLGAVAQWALAMLLLATVGAVAWQAARHVRRREAWTASRMSLTNELVERMVGHRTTLAQEPLDRTRAEADQTLDRYVAPSVALDRSTRRLQTLAPHAWLLLGLAWLGPAFITGGESVTVLAVSLGGLLLGRQGLQRLVDGLDRIVGAWVAWRRLRPFLAEPDRPDPIGDPDFAVSSREPVPVGNTMLGGERVRSEATETEDVLLEGRDLLFRHARRSEPVLQGVEVAIRRGDRVLLEGPSGGGKSTMAALLAGARTQQAGVLLLGGIDRQTLGRAWRRRVVLSPQYHHNHVVMGTFLFNVLLGRAWPPTRADVQEADRVCRSLELGPLLDRMPGGLHQVVGETGWQLSHGERSRLFLARALLQGADMVLLDETFAALDPETLSRTLPRVLEQAPTLLVIAHP